MSLHDTLQHIIYRPPAKGLLKMFYPLSPVRCGSKFKYISLERIFKELLLSHSLWNWHEVKIWLKIIITPVMISMIIPTQMKGRIYNNWYQVWTRKATNSVISVLLVLNILKHIGLTFKWINFSCGFWQLHFELWITLRFCRQAACSYGGVSSWRVHQQLAEMTDGRLC